MNIKCELYSSLQHPLKINVTDALELLQTNKQAYRNGEANTRVIAPFNFERTKNVSNQSYICLLYRV